ncbi:hypothetical protein IKF33_03030 [Candidatus Saccharibacteria bacterium]|nr:hypothetical protein [Candidatus Saccharibacteria bacterium]
MTERLELTGENPSSDILDALEGAEDRRLYGLWSILCSAILYAETDACGFASDTKVFDDLFKGEDKITFRVLSALIKRYADGCAIKVCQLHEDHIWQSCKDAQRVLVEADNPELIVAPGSRFMAVLTDADYGLDLWIWDLNVTR